MPARALIILHPGFEDIEAVSPIDLLTRAEVEVVAVALDDRLRVPSRSGLTVLATHALTELIDEPFDAVILPGGPGIMQIRRHPLICELLRVQFAAGRLIACICAAPLLLLDAGLHTDLRYTCHPSVSNELDAALDAPVVRDGMIITARGAGTAIPFALELVGQLSDHSTAVAIAKSICWPDQL